MALALVLTPVLTPDLAAIFTLDLPLGLSLVLTRIPWDRIFVLTIIALISFFSYF